MGSFELRRLTQKTRNEAFVKNKAELVVLAANARIGEKIKLIPKANKHQSPMAGKLTNGRGATGIPHTSRSRLQKIAAISLGRVVAWNGIMEIEQALPNYLDQARWQRRAYPD
jgi:hypothetical protein